MNDTHNASGKRGFGRSIKPGYLAASAAVLVALLVGLTVYELRESRRIVLESMERGTRSLVEAVARGGENTLRAHSEIESLMTERLLDNARLLRDLEATRTLSDTMLSRIGRENRLFRINVFNPDGRRIASNLPEGYGTGHSPHAPQGVLEPVLSGAVSEMVIGLRKARYEAGSRLAAAAGRLGGGAIVVNVDAADMLDFRRSAGVGRLVQEIGGNPGVAYVVLQDHDGILLASHGVEAMRSIADDPFLKDILAREEGGARLTDYRGSTVFESAMPFAVDDETDGLLRIAVDTDALDVEASRVKRRLVLLGVLLVILGGATIGLVVARRNYAALRAATEADLRRRDRLAAMGELASGVAHEVRNPLNAIGVIVQRLQREFKPEAEGDSYLKLTQTVREEVRRVDGIIKQFLTFARPPVLELSPTNLSRLLESALQVFESQVTSKGLRLARSLDDVGEVRVDPGQMKEVFLNLLENATAATESGEIRVTCSVRDSRWVEVAVEDTGEGIPEADLERIFDLYFTTKPAGTGLGLSLVHRIVNEHGGTVEVESKPGVGSKFRVVLKRGADES
jgi:signal transduction histidine kinase